MQRFWHDDRWALGILGIASLSGYEVVRRLSPAFGLDGNEKDRPLLLVLGVFALLFALYFLAIRVVERPSAAGNRGVLALVFLFAVLFRIQLVFSTPIQERDIYRYIWDGDVGRMGISPFAYAPADFFTASLSFGDPDPNPLRRELLIGELKSNSRMRSCIQTVYYPTVPTIYPPVSQSVFSTLAIVTHGWKLHETVIAFKAFFAALDLIVCGLCAVVCNVAGLPACRLLLYAWCPLVIKESANSGHMDVVAVLPCLIALIGFEKWAWKRPLLGQALTGFALGLGFAAKYFPIWLLLLCSVRILGRKSSLAIAHGVKSCWAMWLGFGLVFTMAFAPFVDIDVWRNRLKDDGSFRNPLPIWLRRPHLPWDGLNYFANGWEMNSPVVAFVRGNLATPYDEPREGSHVEPKDPWYCVLPESARESLRTNCRHLADRFVGNWIADSYSNFGARFLARLVIGAVWFCILCWICWQAMSANSRRFFELAFLLLASFWLMSPMLNPWYIAWFLPLLPVVRVRAWRYLPAFAMIYYLRFWFEAANASGPPTGVQFFDDIVVFIEFVPWMIWMFVETWIRRRQSRIAHIY